MKWLNTLRNRFCICNMYAYIAFVRGTNETEEESTTNYLFVDEMALQFFQ